MALCCIKQPNTDTQLQVRVRTGARQSTHLRTVDQCRAMLKAHGSALS